MIFLPTSAATARPHAAPLIAASKKLARFAGAREARGSYARDTLGATSTESCATVAPPPPANVAENASSRL